MDWHEYDGPPKKILKLDKKEENPPWLAVLTQEKKLEGLLSETADFCKERTEFPIRTGLIFSKLAVSFAKLLNDNLVADWEPQVHIGINSKCEKLVELCVFKIEEDSTPVLHALAVIFNPKIKFHKFNAVRASKCVPPACDILDEKLYARPPADLSKPQGWLVDLINKFGELGGFIILLSKFQPGRRSPTILMIRAVLRPFGLCHELLTVNTIVQYFIPIIERVQLILDTLTDEELKRDAKIPSINQVVSGIIESMKRLVSRVPSQEEIIQNLESLKTRTIFRFLLNVSDIKESVRNLDHQFNVDQWNYFLEYFRTTWKTANDYTREKMLEAIQRWIRSSEIEIGHRVIALLWELAHSDEISTAIMEKAFSAHARLLVYFMPYDECERTFDWLDKCVEEIKNSDKWALRALMHISEICKVFENKGDSHEDSIDVDSVLWHLVETHNFLTLLINNLINYMDKMREFVDKNLQINGICPKPDGLYYHRMQVSGRLELLSNLVQSGTPPPETEQLKQIWECLVKQPIFDSDREDGFKWFTECQIIEKNWKFDRTVIIDFFEQSVLQLDVELLTYPGMLCFKYFFIGANKDDEGKFTVDNLLGIDYLWRVVTNCQEDIARDGFELLNQMNHNVGSQLEWSGADIHKTFITDCRNQLQVHSDKLSGLTGVKIIEEDNKLKKKIVMATKKMDRVMKFLWEYTDKCDWEGN